MSKIVRGIKPASSYGDERKFPIDCNSDCTSRFLIHGTLLIVLILWVKTPPLLNPFWSCEIMDTSALPSFMWMLPRGMISGKLTKVLPIILFHRVGKRVRQKSPETKNYTWA